MSIREQFLQLKQDFDDVYGAGKTAERSDFWEVFQNGGAEANYYYAFAYGTFTDANYNPKYDIKCLSGTTPGRYVFHKSTDITDTKVGIYTNNNDAQYIFADSRLVTIRLFHVHESTNLNNAFQGCDRLVNLTMGGVIGSDLNLKPCTKLSKESIESVVEHLSDNVTGKTVTLSSTALSQWYTPDEWKEYIKIKPNWTFTVA